MVSRRRKLILSFLPVGLLFGWLLLTAVSFITYRSAPVCDEMHERSCITALSAKTLEGAKEYSVTNEGAGTVTHSEYVIRVETVSGEKATIISGHLNAGAILLRDPSEVTVNYWEGKLIGLASRDLMVYDKSWSYLSLAFLSAGVLLWLLLAVAVAVTEYQNVGDAKELLPAKLMTPGVVLFILGGAAILVAADAFSMVLALL